MITIDEKIYNIYTFPYSFLNDFPLVNGKKNITYLNTVNTFDIETTSIVKKTENGEIDMKKSFGFMYHWQFCISSGIEGKVIFGRTWEEFLHFIDVLQNKLFLSLKRRLVVYVHNLAFEFQFIKDFFSWDYIFAREKRKPIKAVTKNGIEFRCSYILSNLSLSAFCEQTPNIVYKKAKGDLDYSVIRTPETPLTNKEQYYCFCDVAGLLECLDYRLHEDGGIHKIPMTSTAYVRNDFRNEVKKNPENIKLFKRMKLDLQMYEMCRREFRGGDTHCNLNYSNEILEDVHSYDITSSYIWCMFGMKYPMSCFIKVKPHTYDEFLSYVNDYACIFDINFYDINCKKYGQMPYIPMAKSYNKIGAIADNGRVLRSDKISMTLTDIDFRIIEKDYEFSKVEIGNMCIAKYDLLPKEYRNLLLKWFRLKCELKGENDYFYMKAKNKLNATYGMMVTDIIRNEICFSNGKWEEKVVDMEKQLQSYYKSHNSFLSYQHGIWTTSNARLQLRKSIWLTENDTVYVDTDCNKHLGEHSADFIQLNNEIYNRIEQLDIKPIININGKEYVCGIWEKEETIKKFKSIGAKKYCCDYGDNIKITVSGLNKKTGSKAIEDMGGIKAFRIGAFFRKKMSGRNVACYQDTDIHKITINGDTFTTASNICLAPTTYKLGITDTYAEVLEKYKC